MNNELNHNASLKRKKTKVNYTKKSFKYKKKYNKEGGNFFNIHLSNKNKDQDNTKKGNISPSKYFKLPKVSKTLKNIPQNIYNRFNRTIKKNISSDKTNDSDSDSDVFSGSITLSPNSNTISKPSFFNNLKNKLPKVSNLKKPKFFSDISDTFKRMTKRRKNKTDVFSGSITLSPISTTLNVPENIVSPIINGQLENSDESKDSEKDDKDVVEEPKTEESDKKEQKMGEEIENLFTLLKMEQEKIVESEKNINKIRSGEESTKKKIVKIKAENKKINESYYKIEEILNKIKILNDKEKSDRGKRVLDMYVMKFFHEHGKKAPTVYFDTYSPKISEYDKFGIDTEEFWVNPGLQLNAIDELLDMKKSRTKYVPEIQYYKVEGK